EQPLDEPGPEQPRDEPGPEQPLDEPGGSEQPLDESGLEQPLDRPHAVEAERQSVRYGSRSRYCGFSSSQASSLSLRDSATGMKSSACRSRSFGSAQLRRRKPAPAAPKHSPPRLAMPKCSSAPSSMYSARPWLVTPSRLQTGATFGN